MERQHKRVVKLSEEQAKRLEPELQGHRDAQFIARVFDEFLRKRAIDEQKAWSEVHRIAGIDTQTEHCVVKWLTNEIFVYDNDNEGEDE